MKNNKNHYVYKLEHVETKEFYFGSRSCNCFPVEEVKYLGSMKTWKKEGLDKSKLIKTILKNDFLTREEANNYEIKIISENINHPLNKNYALPSGKFCTALVKNGIYKKIFFARLEAKRYNKKLQKGLIEPLYCYPDPNIKQIITEFGNGGYMTSLVPLKPMNKHNIKYYYEE